MRKGCTTDHVRDLHEDVPSVGSSMLSASISHLAQEKLPHQSGEIADQVTKFITAFSYMENVTIYVIRTDFNDATQAHALHLVG